MYSFPGAGDAVDKHQRAGSGRDLADGDRPAAHGAPAAPPAALPSGTRSGRAAESPA